MLIQFLMHHYQTKALTQKIYSKLVHSANLLDGVNLAIHLFNLFLNGSYDFFQFKFFYSILEFSSSYLQSSLSSLIDKDGVSPDDANPFLSKINARSIFLVCFPTRSIPEALNDHPNSQDIHFWNYLELLINEFSLCRNHLWSVVKNALILSECSDLNHITFNQFSYFMGIIFPKISLDMVKDDWNNLIGREASIQTDPSLIRRDTISLTSLHYICTSKDENILNVMAITTIKNFVPTFYEMGNSMLEIVSFLVNRLTYYIPVIKFEDPNDQNEIDKLSLKIRDALFKCDISEGLAKYRLLLHNVDNFSMKLVSNVEITNKSLHEYTVALLQNLKLREKLTGLVPAH